MYSIVCRYEYLDILYRVAPGCGRLNVSLTGYRKY